MKFYKEKLKLRLYQQTILDKAIQKNILVVLPTGLGKTYIAIGLAALRLKKNSKILILAPTKPLIVQHFQTFSEYFDFENGDAVVLSGEINPKERKDAWQRASIVFSTPQTIKNDVISGQLNLKSVSLLVLDEAHRAVGDYAYVFLAKAYMQNCLDPKILALTASPGTDEKKINDVCKNLFISAIEARDRKHKEVNSYVKPIITNYHFIELPDEIKSVKKHIEEAIKSRLGELKRLGFIQTTKLRGVTKKNLLALQTVLQARIAEKKFEVGRGLSVCAALMKIQHALSLLESESLSSAKKYFEELWEESKHTKVRAVKDIVSDFHIRAAYALLQSALERGIEHPKLEQLAKVVSKQLKKKSDSKILIFTEFRTNIPKIIEILDGIDGVEVHKFVGQASRFEKGMSQKTQTEIIERFKTREINCLVCTSVAEEGLDIPAVDLIVFYTPVPSAIRSIQRRGRTGRQEIGHLAILITKSTKDEAYYWIAKHKENKMNAAIRNLQMGTREENLERFFVKAEQELPEEKIIIFADVRERGPIVDALYEEGIKVKIGPLKAGDFILSEDVGVERKEVGDFVNSLLDGRLFDQAQTLKHNFSKPIYLIEGDLEQLFKSRNVNPKAVWGSLVALILDWQIPILFSSSPKESAELLTVIAKREQLERKKEISLRGSHKPHTLTDMQEFFVEGLPSIGPTLAKILLREFKSPKKLVNASLEKLKQVKKIGDKKAQLIKRVLDSEYKKK